MDFYLYTFHKKGFLFSEYYVRENDSYYYKIIRKSFLRSKYLFLDDIGEVALVIKKKISLKYHYIIERDGYTLATLISMGSGFKNQYKIQTDNGEYLMKGNFRMKEFTFYDGDIEFAKLSRHSMKRDKRYGLAVSANYDQDTVIACSFIVELIRMLKKQKG